MLYVELGYGDDAYAIGFIDDLEIKKFVEAYTTCTIKAELLKSLVIRLMKSTKR